MSWNFLDGPSRRQHHSSWTVPELLGDGSQHGTAPFRRPTIPNPDLLLQYVDKAISAAEYAQATVELSVLNGPPSSSLLSASPLLLSSSQSLASSLTYPTRHSGSDVSRMPPSIAPRKTSRFKSVSPLPQEYIKSLLKNNRHQEDAAERLGSSDQMIEVEHASLEEDSSSSKEESLETEGSSRTTGEGDMYDARAAEDAYRAAYHALSEGKAELALSLLYMALAKCPPDKPNALGKVHKLIRAATELMEKEVPSTAMHA